MSGVDRRRFNGPEGSSRIRILSRSEPKPLIASETGLRGDSRKPEDIRPIFLKTGLVPQASGSAYIETGKTKIVCAVYGPHPARRDAPYSSRAKLNVEVKFAPFACPGRRKVPGKETEAGDLSARLSQALLPSLRLDLLPKSAIDLFVTVLECDGPSDDISAGTTAASVALANAGVQMYGLVISCCANFAETEGKADRTSGKPASLLDPTHAEAVRSQGSLSLSCMPAMSSSTNVSFEGFITRQLLKDTLKVLSEKCSQIHGVAAQALIEGHKQDGK